MYEGRGTGKSRKGRREEGGRERGRKKKTLSNIC